MSNVKKLEKMKIVLMFFSLICINLVAFGSTAELGIETQTLIFGSLVIYEIGALFVKTQKSYSILKKVVIISNIITKHLLSLMDAVDRRKQINN